MVADGEIEWLAGRRIGDDDIAEADSRIGEVRLGLVAEAARDGPFHAQPDAAGADIEAEFAGDNVIFGIADEAGVELNSPTRFERPAGFLVLNQRRAFPRRGGLDLGGLDGFQRILERLDLGLEQLDLGLQLVDRLRVGARCAGGCGDSD